MKKTFKRKVINGRTYQLLTLPGTDLFKFEIVNKFGANIERVIYALGDKKLFGIAHFIEHLGFRSPRDFTTEELMEMLKIHGSYNASTTHDRINYWFKTNTARADIAINLVCNYALNDLSTITEEEFNIEKKVVYNEAKRYADDDQTMFYFNVEPTICGYHEEDNVIGIPETIDTFTLEDACHIKRQFLDLGNQHGCQTFNVTYDSDAITEEEVISKVEKELKTWYPQSLTSPSLGTQVLFELYVKHLGDDRIGTFTFENEAEQAMTAIMMDVIDNNIIAAQLGNSYLSNYSKTSLNDIIREKNGLTYGVYFYEDTMSYYPYTTFSCDVTKGTEELLITLFEQSINDSVAAFSEDEFTKVQDTIKLKRTLSFIDQQKYDWFHWLGSSYPNIIDKNRELYETDLAKAYETTIRDMATYNQVKDYLSRVQTVVNNKMYSKVTN